MVVISWFTVDVGNGSKYKKHRPTGIEGHKILYAFTDKQQDNIGD